MFIVHDIAYMVKKKPAKSAGFLAVSVTDQSTKPSAMAL
jgi:hypothetical protein